MNILWFLATLLLAYVTSAPVPQDNPPYEVISSGTEYELRQLEARKWVCTSGDGYANEGLRRELIYRILAYFEGNNEQGVKIARTTPVTSEEHNNITTLCYHLPNNHQASPPKPRKESIFIEDRPAWTIAARPFIVPRGEGAPFDFTSNPEVDWEAQATKLNESIKEVNEGFRDQPYYKVFYNAPLNTHFEVWFRNA